MTGFSSSMETAPAADLEEAVQALEERALERQARLESALIQAFHLHSYFNAFTTPLAINTLPTLHVHPNKT